MKIRRTTYGLLLGMMVAALPMRGQEVKWIHRMASNFFSFGNAATADADGNFYITGYFGGDLDFGGTGLTGAGLGDMYIAKYNTNRVLQWVKQGTSDGWNGGRGIAIAEDGSIIVAGRIEGLTNFDGMTVNGVGENDVFVAKYSSTGAIRWVKSGGGSGMDWANGVAVDADGNSYATGYFSGSATFGAQTLTAAGDHDIFIVSYDADGNLRWVKSIGGSGTDEGFGAAVDADGNVFVIGIATGTVNFGTASFAAGGTAGFIARYGSDGTFRWVKGASGNSTAESVSINRETDEIFVAGAYSGTATFGSHTLSSAGSEDIYVVKYGVDGTPAAAWSYGGTGQEGVAGFGQSLELVAAKDGGFYLVSSYENTMTLGTATLTSQGQSDIFVAQFRNDGTARWAISGGGADKDKFVSLGVDGAGNAYLLGNYFSPTFRMGSATLPRFSSVDMVMAKIDGSAATGLPRVALSKNSLAIGDVLTGSSKTGSISVTAGSNVPLTVTGVRFKDPQSGDDGFSITSPASDAFPVELSGSSQLPITVRFAPAATGQASATLIVETNDPAMPSAEVTVSGNGLDGSMLPRAVISVTELDMGDIWIGSTGGKSFTISPGTAAGLTIEGIEFEDPRSIDDGFYLAAPSDFPITLQAGQSLDVVIEYTPADPGAMEAVLVITTNDNADPYKDVDILANATEAPVAEISVTALDFGEVNVGSVQQESFTITGGSPGRLEIAGIALKQETAAGWFRIVSPAPDATYPLTLNEGQKVTVTVEFAPPEKGSVQTALMIETNDPMRQNIEIALAGTGLSVSGVAGDEGVERNAGPVRVMPNPLHVTGEIIIDLQAAGDMRVQLLDVSGRSVAELYNGRYNGRVQRISLDACDLPSGLYFCEVRIGGERYHRMITINR